jgi:hypothetical protein
MKHLEEARLLILNNKADASQDDMLLYLISLSEKRLVFLLNEHLRVRSLPPCDEVPADLEWIVPEVVARRFVRIGREGLTSENVEGHNVSFDTTDDLAAYDRYIATYADSLEAEKPDPRYGVIRGIP